MITNLKSNYYKPKNHYPKQPKLFIYFMSSWNNLKTDLKKPEFFGPQQQARIKTNIELGKRFVTFFRLG